ncbi:MAG: cobalamin-binding protein [Firmicutes bacterium]|nr:cobalamin-binding protein [Bacillota bacterium]
MEELITLMAELEEEQLLQQIEERLTAGEDPHAIFEACQKGMTIVGERFEKGEYYLSDLVMSGEVFRQASELITPYFTEGAGAATKGKVVIGTIIGDIHDIGKDIVIAMLRSAGYEVIDLGVDVPVERFVEAVKESGAPVVGISGLLTVAFPPMKECVDALKAAELDVKVMIGGAPVTAEVCQYVGADAFGSANDAVEFCNKWFVVTA